MPRSACTLATQRRAYPRAAPGRARRTARRAAAPDGPAPGRGPAPRAGARRRTVRAAAALLAGKAGAGERVGDLRLVGAGQPQRRRAAEPDIVCDVEMREQIVLLEDHRDRPRRAAGRSHRAADQDRPADGGSKPAIRLSSVDLAGAARPMTATNAPASNRNVEMHASRHS